MLTINLHMLTYSYYLNFSKKSTQQNKDHFVGINKMVERNIVPEDIKKLERRVKTDEKRMADSSKKLKRK
jgi:hypothetical protein